ncbi:MAG: lipoprotein precursor, partial [uncultured bacterium]
MLRRHPFLAKNPIDRLFLNISQFSAFFSSYLKNKIVTFSIFFEKNKNILVRVFMMKRGRYNRPFLHLATMGVIIVGVLFSPVFANTYPVFSEQSGVNPEVETPQLQQSITVGDDIFQTDISQKPRDKVIAYTVQKGETLSSIARKFGVSVETVKWQNDLTGDSITVGDSLEILPVTGIAHKVSSGETVYSIAKRYDTNPQKIVDFPFNDFANPETFSLVSGQILIVPDGVPPPIQPTYTRPKPVFIAQGPGAVSSAGFAWPLRG